MYLPTTVIVLPRQAHLSSLVNDLKGTVVGWLKGMLLGHKISDVLPKSRLNNLLDIYHQYAVRGCS